MISTSIDGSVGGSNQLFDLLSLVSDPKAYAEKVQALEAATAENKKYVELVAPASDIIRLREVARQEREAAAEELAAARKEAANLIATAKDEATAIRNAANAAASATKRRAQQGMDQVQAKHAELDRAIADAKSAEDRSEHAAAELRALADKAQQAKEDADAMMADAERVRSEIVAQHRAFIASLMEA